MNKQKYQRVLEFLRDRRSLQSTFEGFTEDELREAVEIQNTKGIRVSWCNIMNYLITAHRNYSHDFFVEAVMNATEDILQMPKQEGLAWTKYVLELVERMQIKDQYCVLLVFLIESINRIGRTVTNSIQCVCFL